MIILSTFLVCYAGFLFKPNHKALIAASGALFLVLTNQISWNTAIQEVHWNVMGLFVGTLVLAELFVHSKAPAVAAEWLVMQSRTALSALLKIFALTSLVSMFVENVAVVLILAPVAFSLCEKLKISPVDPLILLAMFSNLQGTATLIGDPPSMILGSYMNMTFNDFFVYQGKPGIFFIVQAGALSSFLLTSWIFQNQKQPITSIRVEKIRSWVPTILLCLLIFILATGSGIDPEGKWLAGSLTIFLACIGLLWNHFGAKWSHTSHIFKALDWDTTFFLGALFILVGALRIGGWIDLMAQYAVEHIPPNPLTIYLFILGISILISAVVDNVPYLIVMIPFVEQITSAHGKNSPVFLFALLVGACLGGNITPIGASANIVAMGFLKNRNYSVSLSHYLRRGILFTSFAVIPAALVLWIIWS